MSSAPGSTIKCHRRGRADIVPSAQQHTGLAVDFRLVGRGDVRAAVHLAGLCRD
jgi:hypothetical protein